jgi:hypothetical protein
MHSQCANETINASAEEAQWFVAKVASCGHNAALFSGSSSRHHCYTDGSELIWEKCLTLVSAEYAA